MIADVQNDRKKFPGKDPSWFSLIYNGHILIEKMAIQMPFHGAESSG